MNPDTTYGLSVVDEVLVAATVVQANRAEAAGLAASSKIQAEGKRVARRQKKSESFNVVVLAVSMGRHVNWAKLTGAGGIVKADTLRLAMQEWVGDPKYGKGTRVKDLAIDFARRFGTMLMAFIICAKMQCA